ncbi:hypothetical protein EYF80_013726 [Liparis tanakae]|uniref:Uncharacterized protein n=1 Tax=Liparis tanakae TaxID=230148 RepID=A0A4Z2IFR9_9TELE|nr:hypothetical protein EYF80_013726 [Liparis tanakae]
MAVRQLVRQLVKKTALQVRPRPQDTALPDRLPAGNDGDQHRATKRGTLDFRLPVARSNFKSTK